MLPRTYDGQTCSLARALEVVGERWTMLILRDVFMGLRRFEELHEHLGVTRSVLSTRLAHLVEEGVLERRPYQARPERFEYRLTEKGLGLWPATVALMQWGDAHYAPPEGPPVRLVHEGCGGTVDARRTCDRCGAPLGPRDVRAVSLAPAPA